MLLLKLFLFVVLVESADVDILLDQQSQNETTLLSESSLASLQSLDVASSLTSDVASSLSDIDMTQRETTLEATFSSSLSTTDNPSSSPSTESIPTETPNITPDKETFMQEQFKGKTDRFNYASFDCGALILATNKEAASATSILIRSRDQYMLNKCAAEKFVIVELCQEILVNSVVLSNFEFFSSMFKTFEVSVSETYPPKTGWTSIGVFTAQNNREEQEFQISLPRMWTKYLRIDFTSHYGKEFYCPLSLLKVYGTSMIEDVRSVDLEDELETEIRVAPPIITIENVESIISTMPTASDQNQISSSTLVGTVNPANETLSTSKETLEEKTIQSSTIIVNAPGTTTIAVTIPVVEFVKSNVTSSTLANSTANVPTVNSTSTTSETFVSAPPSSNSIPAPSTTFNPIPPTPNPVPTTQESILKSIVKRLTILEKNLTQLIKDESEAQSITSRFGDDIRMIVNDHRALREEMTQKDTQVSFAQVRWMH